MTAENELEEANDRISELEEEIEQLNERVDELKESVEEAYREGYAKAVESIKDHLNHLEGDVQYSFNRSEAYRNL